MAAGRVKVGLETREISVDNSGVPGGISGSESKPIELKIDSNTPLFDAKSRSKTSLRIRYEAEVQVIKRKLGDLEGIRTQLRLSQRKICQLLLVDPSAWSRWVRLGEDAPPHIYKMLQWYLVIEEKYPALDVNFWLSTVARSEEPMRAEIRDLHFKQQLRQFDQIPGQVEQLSVQMNQLQRTYEKQRRLLGQMVLLSALSVVLALGVLTWRLVVWFGVP